MQFLQQPTRLLLFTGKGGVGKTSVACATGITLADQGRRVLLVSTDPASNLGQVFGVTIGEHEPTPIPDVPGLWALNINPEAAAQLYRERIVGPVRALLPADVVRGMEEQLSGACTTEIAAFDEFTGLLTEHAATGHFDHVLFDTAPTGHTLRLLQLPTAWSNFFDSNTSGASCLGPLAGLEKQRHQYAFAVTELANPASTTIVLVARPQSAALAEASRTSQELATLGIVNQQLLINGRMPDTGSDDPLAVAVREREAAALAALPGTLARLPCEVLPLLPRNTVGVAALRSLFAGSASWSSLPTPAAELTPPSLPPLSTLIDGLAANGHGVVMVLGKGGVGKTTVAAAIAVELAARGYPVHLTTTDPAAHLSLTVESQLPRLTVSRIDPQLERDRYRQQVLETKGQHLDDAGRKLLEEDLRSPCTDEIAVFQAFSRILEASQDCFVVIDTAPTGHTLLLLDAAGSYHRETVRHASADKAIETPLQRLQDPTQTKLFIVTLAETTPVLEAEALQADLRRAGIEPWAWVINASWSAAAPRDPLLRARAAEELGHIARVQQQVPRVAIVPWQLAEPVGSTRLLALVRSRVET